MAAGDLLYIVAFIILPTAVLVSCIWALVLLRNGTLLPARPRPLDDRSEEWLTESGYGPVEETGEHLVIEPAQGADASVVPDVAIPVPPAPAHSEPAPPVAVPPIQSTQEFQIVPGHQPEEPAPSGTVEPTDQPPAKPNAMQDGLVQPEAGLPARTDEDDASLMIVPLDDQAGAVGHNPAAAAKTPVAHVIQSQVGNGKTIDSAARTSGPRRSTRHLTPPRSLDGPGSSTRSRVSQRRAGRRSDIDR